MGEFIEIGNTSLIKKSEIRSVTITRNPIKKWGGYYFYVYVDLYSGTMEHCFKADCDPSDYKGHIEFYNNFCNELT